MYGSTLCYIKKIENRYKAVNSFALSLKISLTRFNSEIFTHVE